MMLCGMPSGGCRLPLCDIGATGHLQKLKQLVSSLPSHGQVNMVKANPHVARLNASYLIP